MVFIIYTQNGYIIGYNNQTLFILLKNNIFEVVL